MSNNIISTGGKVFQKFLSQLTSDLTKPNARFIREFLCGVLFSDNLVLTNIAAKVPCAGKLTAIAKRFRRQLAARRAYLEKLWSNYLSLLHRRVDTDSTFIVDLSDSAKPYARKMECLAWVRDGDKDRLVPGYWSMEVYWIDLLRCSCADFVRVLCTK